MINRYDDFSKLQEVVLGKVNYSPLEYMSNENNKHFLRTILEETENALENLAGIFKSFGVTVWRPEVFTHYSGLKLGSPYVYIDHVYSALTPYDNFLTIANTLVEMSPHGDPSAMYDYVQYQHIWKEKFMQGSRWISMPRPSYNPKKNNDAEHMPDFEPYADAPSLMIIGDTIFVAEKYMVNNTGLDWLKREFPQFKFEIFQGTNGHLDSYFSVVRPGVGLSGIPKNALPEKLQKWEILEFNKEDYKDVSMLSNYFQDDDHENTTLAVNTFSIDESNIIMAKHTVETCVEQVKKLENIGVNVIPLEIDVSRWLNQGIHCMCNALAREGDLNNYF
jgi:glycine amidinotransferase